MTCALFYFESHHTKRAHFSFSFPLLRYSWSLLRQPAIPSNSKALITSPNNPTIPNIDCWIKRDQLDVTCFLISLFNVQHVSDVNTSILSSLRLICYFMGCIALVRCVLVLRCGLAGVVWYPDAGWSTQQISRKLLRMDVLTSETCWTLNNEIKKQVTSSWSLFIQLSRWCTVQ